MKLFRKAILVIHGFSGGLCDNEFLVNELETYKNFDVYAWTLPAHEKHIIRKVTVDDWTNAVDKQMEFLINHGYKKIYVIGHSMGGVLAGYLASKYKQVKKVVFLSAAYDYISTEQNIDDFRLKNIRNLKTSETAYKNFFIKLIKVPITTAIQFRILIKKYKDCIKDVKQETLVLHGNKDEVVPYSTIDYIKENIGSKKVTFTTIDEGRHITVRSRKQNEVIDYIKSFLIGGLKWKYKKKKEL